MSQQLPYDETGDLLRLMQEQGDDLGVARNIDFFLIFDTEAQAQAFASRADLGPEFKVAISRYERTAKWQVTLTVCMLPVYAELVMLEKQVARLGHEQGGEADGWGCTRVDNPGT
ncbi:MAG: ribonuclease E inhibitor RraB [Gammaproteobacteria bacterium PRO9]|nr:ribonuclease E inhibitor RraB [Gammaproteobacteria bacterium PRO9]